MPASTTESIQIHDKLAILRDNKREKRMLPYNPGSMSLLKNSP